MEKRPRDRIETLPRADSSQTRIRRPLSMPSRRIPLERKVTLDFPHTEGIVTEALANVSMTGMFVRSERPEPPGARVAFELDLAGDRPPILGQAEVVWGRPQDEGLGRPAGKGLRFIEIDSAQRDQIREAVEQQLRRGVAEFKLEESAEKPGIDPAEPRPPKQTHPVAKLHPYAGAAFAKSAADKQRPWKAWTAAMVAVAIVLALVFLIARRGLDPPNHEEPAQPETVAADDEDQTLSEVLETVASWARAWSEQRAEAYLSFYSLDFHPPGGLSRERWGAQRKSRLTAPKRITVRITEITTRFLHPDRCTVSFLQDYASDSYRDSTRKVLELALQDGKWMIVAERTSS